MGKETFYIINRKDNYPFFGIASLVYAIFYTFCLYRNASGITMPFFAVGSLLFGYLCMQKLEISIKRDVWFYAISMLLLSISSFCTDDGMLHFYNLIGIGLLLICFYLHQFYEDSRWGFGKYFCAVFQQMFGSVFCGYYLFADGFMWGKIKDNEKAKKGIYIFIGLIISAPILLIVSLLLLTSDYVIRNMVFNFLEKINLLDIILCSVLVVIVFFVSYGCITYLTKQAIREEVYEKRVLEPVVMITITGLLSIIYLFYSVIQILYLFLGKMSLPNGYTYAEYAREGFFQLLIVCVLNLILVLISIRFFKKSRILQIVLTIVSACTYIMIASSTLRMIMYIRFYYLTTLRILVLWTLCVLFFLLSGLVISIYKEKFPLFRYSVIIVTSCYLILAYIRPDYWIAKINVTHISEVKSEFFLGEPYEDYYYLSTLSLDAAEIVKPIMDQQDDDWYRKDVWMRKFNKNKEEYSIRRFNLSRFKASQI